MSYMSHPQAEDKGHVRQQNVPFAWLPVVILVNQSLSNEVDLGHYVVCAIQIPDTWNAADLTFRSRCAPELPIVNVHESDGDELTVDASTTSRFIIVDPADFAGIRFLTIRSGTAAVPVPQGGNRELRLMVRAV